jgi:hypothetical protein
MLSVRSARPSSLMVTLRGSATATNAPVDGLSVLHHSGKCYEDCERDQYCCKWLHILGVVLS